ncbi:MAG: hypothetical protein J0H07_10990 [Sphingobacteriales bacterium]|nr:hypothetical protein [Sphingobacteriales bacterium]
MKLEAFSIFNRRGMQVFTTQDPSLSWDGNYHGQPQPLPGDDHFSVPLLCANFTAWN